MPKPIDPTKIAIRGTTQEHLDIEDIQDDLVILKDGSCCLVIATTAINFGLLSEKEQEATIYAYASLLNSLSFPIQIVIRSRREDISNYLKLIDQRKTQVTQPEIKQELEKYKQFVRETVQKNEVLDKDFYLIIPMSFLELGAAKTLASTFSRKKGLPFEKSYILERAKINLYPKRDYLLKLVRRLGLSGKQLTTVELTQLFFEIYNPEGKNQQAIAGQFQQPPVQSPPGEEATPPPEPSPPSETPTQSSPAANSQPSPEEKQSAGKDILQKQINDLVEKATS